MSRINTFLVVSVVIGVAVGCVHQRCGLPERDPWKEAGIREPSEIDSITFYGYTPSDYVVTDPNDIARIVAAIDGASRDSIYGIIQNNIVTFDLYGGSIRRFMAFEGFQGDGVVGFGDHYGSEELYEILDELDMLLPAPPEQGIYSMDAYGFRRSVSEGETEGKGEEADAPMETGSEER
jgi:hypothetical protein